MLDYKPIFEKYRDRLFGLDTTKTKLDISYYYHFPKTEKLEYDKAYSYLFNELERIKAKELYDFEYSCNMIQDELGDFIVFIHEYTRAYEMGGAELDFFVEYWDSENLKLLENSLSDFKGKINILQPLQSKLPEYNLLNKRNMNYHQVLLDAFIANKKHKTTYMSFFKREAQIAKRDNFVEFPDYFDGCQYILESYKNEITKQYNKRLTENDWVVASVKSGSGMKFEGEIVTDQSDKRIQDHLQYIAEDKEFVQNRGYENNHDYACFLKETGEVINDIWGQCNERKLCWQDIVQIEQGVYQAKEELLVQNSANLQTKFSQNNTTSEPLSEFEGFLRIKDQTIISSIVEIIRKDIKNSKSKNLTIALITVALQKKSYLPATINQTTYHRSLVGLFGKNIGTRSKFSEMYGEIIKEHYENQLNEYMKLLPKSIVE